MKRRDISKALLVSAAGANVLTSHASPATPNGQTPAELRASVTPANEQYPELYLERYGGGASEPPTHNDAALNSAIAVARARGCGVIRAPAAGTYKFSSSFTLPQYVTLQGGGYATILSYLGSGPFLTLGSNSGRAGLADLLLVGTARRGTGVTLGDESGNAGFCRLERVLVSNFGVGMRIGGATWLTCEQCEFGNAAGGRGAITNNIGVDFHYFGGKNYTSALTFRECVVANNAYAGVQASNVAVTMNEVAWINCSVQNNCQSDPRNAQFHMGSVIGFTLDNLYMEYVLGGTAPDALRTDNLSCGQIRSLYVDIAATGIIDRGGSSMSLVEIVAPRIFDTTTAGVRCVSERDVVVRGGSITGSVTLSGTGCVYLPPGSGLASWPRNESSFVPVLTAARGSIEQTQTGTWSQVGNVVTVAFRIDWTSTSGASGGLTIRELPLPPKKGLPDVGLALGYFTGISLSDGQVAISVPSGTTIASIHACSQVTTELEVAALASSGSLVVAGSYQV